MIKNKALTEIILICVGGLITVGLSVNSIIKSKDQEEELKEKSNSIIDLQKQLQEKSNSQIQELNRLRNPIPSELEISFEGNIVLTELEFKKILKKLPSNKNYLPTEENIPEIENINKIKNLRFEIIIEFSKDGKTFKIKVDKAPIPFLGYNSARLKNTILITLNKKKNSLNFNARYLKTSDITSNYFPASLLDFKSSKVKITYSFWYPQDVKFGSLKSTMYLKNNKKNDIFLNFESLYLRNKNYTMKVDSIQKKTNYEFIGAWNGIE